MASCSIQDQPSEPHVDPRISFWRDKFLDASFKTLLKSSLFPWLQGATNSLARNNFHFIDSGQSRFTAFGEECSLVQLLNPMVDLKEHSPQIFFNCEGQTSYFTVENCGGHHLNPMTKNKLVATGIINSTCLLLGHSENPASLLWCSCPKCTV